MPDHNGAFKEFGLSMLISIVLLPTGAGEISSQGLSIYLNPGNGRFVIAVTDEIQKITIFNLSGQLINEGFSEDSSIEINLTGLNRGTYFVKIEMKNGTLVSEKLIIK